MKVLIITTNSVKWGGSEELWYSVANELVEAGHEVMVSVFMHRDFHENVIRLKKKGAVLHQRPFPSYYKGQRFTGRVLAELKLRTGLENTRIDWIKVIKFKPESVLISSGETFDYSLSDKSFIVKYCHKNQIPFYLISQFNWEHDMDITDQFRDSRKKLVQLSSGNLFVSIRNYKTAERQIAGQIPNVRIICNPIKTDVKLPLPFPNSNVAKIAVVARYQSFIKGQDLLIKSLSSNALRDIPFIVSLYGSGDDASYLEKLISFYNLNDKVRICGSASSIEEVWKENQFFILPSRAEGTSLAMLEAMGSGRTGLVTNVGDSAIWVGNRGFVAASNTSEELIQVLVKAFDQFHNWEKLGIMCKSFIEKHHIADQAFQISKLLAGESKLETVGYSSEEYYTRLTN